ncbi:MAG: nucleoside hydrolase [Anaerolineales bacterium]
MRRIIIDCDPGIDDAQAIMMAYQYPEVKIEAITTVASNVGVDLTTANTLKVLDALNAEEIPVYAGAKSGLVQTSPNVSIVHGKDGLGDADIPTSNRHVAEGPAALALIQLANAYPEEVELIAIGPLTNLALAIRLDPDLASRYKHLVIMGGAYFAQGNTPNHPAKFNIFADADAAAVVFENWFGFTMISWEATVAHGISMEALTSLLVYDNPRSQFLAKISEKPLNFMAKRLNRNMSFTASPLAMAVLLEPEIVLVSEQKYVQIERYGQLSRGMTVVDWLGLSHQSPNTNIVLEVDTYRFFHLLK